MKPYLYSFFLFFFLLLSCQSAKNHEELSQNETAATTAEAISENKAASKTAKKPVFIKYDSPSSSFTIEYPETWERMEADGIASKDSVAFKSPGTKSSRAGFEVHSSYEKRTLPPTRKTKGVFAQYDDEIKNGDQDSSLREIKKTTFKGEDCIIRLTEQNETIRKSYYFYHNNDSYVLNFIADKQDFNEYSPVFDRIAESFTFKDTAADYKEDLIKYDSPDADFTFEFSPSWKPTKVEPATNAVAFANTASSNPRSQFVIIYLPHTVGAPKTGILKRYKDSTAESIQENNRSMKNVELHRTKIGGEDAVLTVFDEISDNRHPTRNKSYRFYHKGGTVMMDFEAATDDFSIYEPIFDAIAASFAFTEQKVKTLPEKKEPAKIEKYIQYRSPGTNFTFEYPSGWDTNYSVETYNLEALSFKEPENSKDPANFIIWYEGHDSGYYKNKNLSDEIKRTVRGIYKDDLIAQETVPLAGEKAELLIYRAGARGSGTTLNKVYYLYHEGGKAVLFFSCIEQYFKDYEPVFDKIAESFKFTSLHKDPIKDFSAKKGTDISENLIKFDSPYADFTFDIPDSWRQTKIMGTPGKASFAFRGPGDGWDSPSLSISSFYEKDKIPPSQAERSVFDNFDMEVHERNSGSAGSLLELHNIRFKGTDCMMSIRQGDITTSKSYRFNRNGNSYNMNFGVSNAKFKEYEPVFDKIALSFQFKDKD